MPTPIIYSIPQFPNDFRKALLLFLPIRQNENLEHVIISLQLLYKMVKLLLGLVRVIVCDHNLHRSPDTAFLKPIFFNFISMTYCLVISNSKNSKLRNHFGTGFRSLIGNPAFYLQIDVPANTNLCNVSTRISTIVKHVTCRQAQLLSLGQRHVVSNA